MKTGALFAASCEMGAMLGGAEPEARAALRAYGHMLGLAFQIADDLLDVEADGGGARQGDRQGRRPRQGDARRPSRPDEGAPRLAAAVAKSQRHLARFGADGLSSPPRPALPRNGGVANPATPPRISPCR